MQRSKTLTSRFFLKSLMTSMLSVMLVFVIGCSGGVSSNGNAVTAAPLITAFASSPTSINIGGSSVLTWSTYGATSVTLSGVSGQMSSPVTVSPTTTTTYTLTATNAAGTTTAATTVTVIPVPVISSFTASSASILQGQSSSLSWVVSGATSVSLSGFTSSVISPVVVKPSATTTYTLTASNGSGSVTATTTVTVGPALPVINSFTASTKSITAGQPVSLTWSVTGATSTQLSGVTVSPPSPVIVYPSAATIYTLTASNSSGSATATVSIAVSSGTTLNTGGAITVGSPGQSVPATFMGFSIGSTSYTGILGIPATGANPIYRKLLSNLTAFGGGPIIMRIGGNSAETQGVPTVASVSSLAQLATDSGVKYILGLSLAPDVVSLAVQQAQAFTGGMPAGSIIAAEIGNEPDLYVENGSRTTYTNAQYLADYANFRTSVLPVMSAVGAKVTGPAWSSSGSLTNLPSFLAQETGNLALVTQHSYGGTDCNSKVEPVDYLLQEGAQSGAANVASGVAPTHAAGIPYRLGESNTISCSGQAGVSNTFQAALWSMDWMSRLAGEGVDGINFFGDNDDAYSIFEFNTGTSGGKINFSIGTINPQYYGLIMFQQATQNAARFLPLSYTGSGNQKAYAWLDASGNIRVLVLNKDEAQSGTFAVSLAGYGAATMTRLTASTYSATTGVLFGGQTMDGSTDGSLQGSPYGELVAPASGVYTFAMPVTSAVLLTIPHN